MWPDDLTGLVGDDLHPSGRNIGVNPRSRVDGLDGRVTGLGEGGGGTYRDSQQGSGHEVLHDSSVLSR